MSSKFQPPNQIQSINPNVNIKINNTPDGRQIVNTSPVNNNKLNQIPIQKPNISQLCGKHSNQPSPMNSNVNQIPNPSSKRYCQKHSRPSTPMNHTTNSDFRRTKDSDFRSTQSTHQKTFNNSHHLSQPKYKLRNNTPTNRNLQTPNTQNIQIHSHQNGNCIPNQPKTFDFNFVDEQKQVLGYINIHLANLNNRTPQTPNNQANLPKYGQKLCKKHIGLIPHKHKPKNKNENDKKNLNKSIDLSTVKNNEDLESLNKSIDIQIPDPEPKNDDIPTKTPIPTNDPQPQSLKHESIKESENSREINLELTYDCLFEYQVGGALCYLLKDKDPKSINYTDKPNNPDHEPKTPNTEKKDEEINTSLIEDKLNNSIVSIGKITKNYLDKHPYEPTTQSKVHQIPKMSIITNINISSNSIKNNFSNQSDSNNLSVKKNSERFSFADPNDDKERESSQKSNLPIEDELPEEDNTDAIDNITENTPNFKKEYASPTKSNPSLISANSFELNHVDEDKNEEIDSLNVSNIPKESDMEL